MPEPKKKCNVLAVSKGNKINKQRVIKTTKKVRFEILLGTAMSN